MNYYFNLLLCIAFLMVLIFEVYLILKRNRTIKIKGKDDYFTTVLIMLFVILIFPLDLSSTLLEFLRNTLAIMILFVSFAVKRGVTDKGFAKFGFIIPWNKIRAVYFDSSQSYKFTVNFKISELKFKLIFSESVLKNVFETATANCSEVMVDKVLDLKLRSI